MKPLTCIFGPPRSGTTWTGQIFNSSPDTFYITQIFYYNRNKFPATRNFIDKNLDMLIKHMSLFKGSFFPSDPGGLNKVSDSMKYLNFKKNTLYSHLVFRHVRYHHLIEDLIQLKDAKIIGLIRDPRATINSWLHAPREFYDHLDPLKEWYEAPTKNANKTCYEYAGYLNWQRIANNYIKFPPL